VVMGKPSTSDLFWSGNIVDIYRPLKKSSKPEKSKDGGEEAKSAKSAKVNRYDYQGGQGS
jgi:hypothetical protein